MLWFYFSLLAAFLWSVLSVIDKIVVNKAFRKSFIPSTINGIANIVFILLFLLIFNLDLSFNFFNLILIIAGMLLFFGSLLYYDAFLRDEMTRNLPVFGIIPVIVLILAVLFLNENLSTANLIGVFLIVLGASLVSFKLDKRKKKKLIMGKAVVFAVVSSFFFALTRILTKYALMNNSILMQAFILPQIGFSFTALIFFFIKSKEVLNEIKSKKKFALLLGLGQSLNFTGNLSFTAAISLGFVSLSSTIIAVHPFFALIWALILSSLMPRILKESFTRKELILKLTAVLFVVVGVSLLL